MVFRERLPELALSRLPKPCLAHLAAMLVWTVGAGGAMAAARPAAAQEAPVYVVDGVVVPGFGGEMTALVEGQQTAAARLFNEANLEGAPLSPGMALALGDRIVCTRARVVIRRGDETIHVMEGAEVELTAERSTLQLMGEVYYQVREAFQVQYGSVETTVEGTRFLVVGEQAGAGPVQVAVDEGTVRVDTPEGRQRVTAGNTLTAAPGSAPPAASAWPARAKGAALAKTVGMGRPRFMVGALVQGSWTGSSADTLGGVGAAQLRPIASIRLAGPVHAVIEPGIAVGTRTLQLPVNAGLELSMFGIRAGGTLTTTYETRRESCGAEQELLHIGGAGHVRAEVPLGRHIRALGSARVGVASVLNAELGAGIGWAF